jgi:dTDP-4-amino-4,6-dideoxygalactose transaminase
MIRFGTVDFGEKERNAIMDLMSIADPMLTLGARVHEFERKFAGWIGSKYAVMVNSGTSALITAILAYDEPVLATAALTYCATWNAIKLANKMLILQDVGNDFVVHNGKVPCVAVHLLGKPCRAFNGIEDTSEALGSKIRNKKLGTFAALGTFSFYVAHIITTVEGGMVVTDSKELYEKCLSIRDNGRICVCPECSLKTTGKCLKRLGFNQIERRWMTRGLGFNFKPTEFQGVLGLVKMDKIDWICGRRHEIYKIYEEEFHSLPEEPDEFIVPLAYPVQVSDPRQVLARLEVAGIEARGMFPAYSQKFKNAYRISQSYILLPNHQNLSDENVKYIIECVRVCQK